MLTGEVIDWEGEGHENKLTAHPARNRQRGRRRWETGSECMHAKSLCRAVPLDQREQPGVRRAGTNVQKTDYGGGRLAQATAA